MKIYWSGGIAAPFLTSALNGGEWLASLLDRITPALHPAGWAPCPVWTLWRTEKSCPAGNQTRAVQPVARHYLCMFTRIGRLMNNELERMWKEVVVAQSEALSWHLITETDESQYCRCSSRDSNRSPPKYKPEELLRKSINSVCSY
jgi:hypothetical protein